MVGYVWLGIVVALLIVYLIVYLALQQYYVSGFDNRRYVSELVKSRDIINQGYTSSKRAFNWMDPVLYEDVRALSFRNRYTEGNIAKLLE